MNNVEETIILHFWAHRRAAFGDGQTHSYGQFHFPEKLTVPKIVILWPFCEKIDFCLGTALITNLLAYTATQLIL